MKRDLYGRLFEASAFPLLDRISGTSISAVFAALEAAEHLDRDEIAARQTRKLAVTVELARRASPFYRELWTTAGPRSSHPVLDGLPVVTKAQLAAAPEAFPLPGFRGRVVTSRTSGSTGSPMVFHRSLEQESWFWALRFRIWSWAGYRPGDPYLTINLNPRLGWRKHLQDVLFRCAYLTFNADNQDSARIVARLSADGIRHLNGFSSSLYVLARYMIERGAGAPCITGVTSTGDTLFAPYREAVEQAFGVRVLDYYGAGGEGVHLASQCPQSGTRYHLHPENAVVELLDERGPVPPGVPGRLVVTQLDNAAMPLIRYELGDVAVGAPPHARCACGRTLPLLERVEGRIPDLIAVPDGTFLVTHFFVVLFKNLQSIDRYQVVQDEHDRIRVRLVGRLGAEGGEVETAVRRAVETATRGLLAVEFEWVDEIPLSGAGKRRLVVSRFGREAIGGARRTEETPDA